jgi:phage tail-like protein
MTAPAAPAARPAAQPGNWVDPFRSYNFKLIVDKVAEGHFTEVSGLGVKVERISYREAGNPTNVVRAVPGRVTYSSVTLRYGLSASAELWDWMSTAVTGRVDRRTAHILMLDSAGISEVMRWTLTNAWAEQWQGAVLDAMSHELAIETLVIAHEGLQRVTNSGSTAPPA